MKCIVTDLDHIDSARGLVVVIDVLRAFSTICYAFHNHAEKFIPVETIEEAQRIRKNHKNFLLLGERSGKPVEGFDFTNSPAQIEHVDFLHRTIIMTTSQGTKGIVRAIHAEEIITGSFVNSQAIISYIHNRHPKIVSFVCTDSRYIDNEDYLCASYLERRIENKPTDFEKILTHLKNHPCTDGFLKNPTTQFSQKDFELCMKLDAFSFVIQAKKIRGTIQLVKV